MTQLPRWSKQVLPILFVLLLTSVVPATTQAQQAVRIGTVDLGALVMFHPLMANYDPFRKLFTRPSGTPKDALVTQAAATRQTQEVEEQLARLREKIPALDARMLEARRRHDRLVEEARIRMRDQSRGASRETATAAQSQFQVTSAQLDQKMAAETRGIEIERQALLDEITRLEVGGPAAIRGGENDTQKTFQSILADIRRVCNEVASRHGIAVVLDAGSAGFRLVMHERPSTPTPTTNLYAQMLTQQMPPNLTRDGPAVKGFYNIMEEQGREWYQHRGTILEPFRGQMFSSYVVSGGIDLTQEVLVQILTQYGVNKSVHGIVIQALRSATSGQ